MISISLCMIVKNEEDVLERCLSSVYAAVDEIIIVDTGSTDKTKDIAAKFTSKIYDFEWVNDFSLARNFAFSKATMDYQMWLDADDIIPKEETEKLIKLKTELAADTDVVTMKYHIAFDELGTPVFSSTRERLFRREAGFLWMDPVHEYVEMRGKIIHSDICIHHKKHGDHGDRNLKIYEELLKKGKKFSPRSTYYYARELRDNERYEDAAEYFTKFLDEKGGWVEDNIAACLALGRIYNILNENENALPAFLRSFIYDLPRPEACCEIGYYYTKENNYFRAAYWFNAALSAPKIEYAGFVNKDYYGFIPHIELCVCYSRMGNNKLAVYHNEQADKFKPGTKAVEQNRKYFNSLEATQ